MTTSHGGRNGWGSGDDQEGTVGRFEHYTTGLGGFLVTLTLLIVGYPVLRASVEPLHALSSTAIVAVAVVAWASSWYALEVLWEWRR
ncbi:MAG: hypothetical protein ABEJ67_00585 [Halanaeroarchaeum sp.]